VSTNGDNHIQRLEESTKEEKGNSSQGRCSLSFEEVLTEKVKKGRLVYPGRTFVPSWINTWVGNLADRLVLSQLLYWLEPDKDGNCRSPYVYIF
jgi:hypothetical protein